MKIRLYGVIEMWKFTRNDAVTVWSQDIIRKRLQRYRSIIDLKLPARYLLARNISVDLSDTMTMADLWKSHNNARKDFKKLFREVKETGEADVQNTTTPSFLDLKIQLANRIIESCTFCERRCKTNRVKQLGYCRVNNTSYVSSAFLHSGEEAPLVPSGTIFFSGCNFRCAHCQNYDISCNPKNGRVISHQQLASIADELASQGAKNINYVGGEPTPHLHTILGSMKHQQFNITQLWNSNMYLSEEAIDLLTDIIDFWLPDLKYFSDACAERISDASNYTPVVTRNIKTAYLKGTNEMIIRVLVLPNHLQCCVIPILDWISQNTPKALVNIMAQYRPLWQVLKQPDKYADITSRVSQDEMKQAYDHAERLGLEFRSVS
ncbi:MAG: radical SAM protein [Promethearchaeota archaeon]